jgi:hypothetical protein
LALLCAGNRCVDASAMARRAETETPAERSSAL